MTTDAEQGERVADRIEAGMVYVNLVRADSPELPSAASSGPATAASSAVYGADEFVNKKLIRSA